MLSVAGLASLLPATSDGGNARRVSCDPVSRMEARNERLSAVLQRLSRDWGFTVKFLTTVDPIVNVVSTDSQLELMRRLTANANAITKYRSTAACPNALFVESVWILDSSAAEQLQPPISPPRPPPPPRLSEEQEARIELFKRAHSSGP